MLYAFASKENPFLETIFAKNLYENFVSKNSCL